MERRSTPAAPSSPRSPARRFATATGLTLITEIARRTYEKGQQVSRDFLNNLPIHFHEFLPNLNDTTLSWT